MSSQLVLPMNDPREYAAACDSVSFVAKLALDEVQLPGPVLLNSPKSTFWKGYC
jgi:hypothetical protein